MTEPTHPDALLPDAADADERNLWMPPRRLLRYQFYKLATGLGCVVIFSLWLYVGWHHPGLRWLALGLMTVTLWVVGRSLWRDAARARGRQLAVSADYVWITTPAGTQRLPLAAIASAVWRVDTQAQTGLWLYDAQHQPLAHLDTGFFEDEAECRTFLGWARQRAPMCFPVRWPDPLE